MTVTMIWEKDRFIILAELLERIKVNDNPAFRRHDRAVVHMAPHIDRDRLPLCRACPS